MVRPVSLRSGGDWWRGGGEEEEEERMNEEENNDDRIDGWRGKKIEWTDGILKGWRHGKVWVEERQN